MNLSKLKTFAVQEMNVSEMTIQNGGQANQTTVNIKSLKDLQKFMQILMMTKFAIKQQ